VTRLAPAGPPSDAAVGLLALLGVVLAGTVAGCGSGRGPAAAAAIPAASAVKTSPAGSPAPSVTATPAATDTPVAGSGSVAPTVANPTPSGFVPPVPVIAPTTPVPFTGPAAREFGPGEVQAAYRVGSELALRTTFDRGTVRLAHPRRADVSYADAYLTTAGRGRLDAAVAHQTVIPAGADVDRLRELVSYGYGSVPGYRLTARSPYVATTAAGPAQAYVRRAAGRPYRLDLRFTVSGYVLFTRTDGTRQRLLLSKDVTFLMAPVESGGKDGWLVDDWFGRITAGLPEPDPTG